MFAFGAEQKVLEIAGVKVGGVPGERPVVLVGSIFYSKHTIVKDEFKGEFDRAKAEKLINVQDEMSDKTGIPCMLDVIGATSEALIKYISFVSEATDAPLLLDGTTASVRLEALKYVRETGLAKRIVYNTITPRYEERELQAIRDAGVKNAVVLAYYPKDFTSRGRVKSIKELIPKILERGIANLLVDTCVLDVPSLGSACKALYDLKNELGYPTGCGSHNAISTWKGLQTKMGPQAFKPSVASSVVMAITAGADFVLYGRIDNADFVLLAAAMADAALAGVALERGKRPSLGHPIFKIA